MSIALSPTRLVLKVLLGGTKKASSVFRSVGVGANHPQWEARAEICQRCPLLHVKCGKTYCGRPFLQQIEREEATEGCGCPVNAKAKDPTEHCPRNAQWEASSKTQAGSCDCVWCVSLRDA
ncbi:MAG TPA: hypothetical protein PK402_13595 [Tepidisphaeraceae bacterium]|nr:hypothetical protein [Tepidisphaeraceae bacterium]